MSPTASAPGESKEDTSGRLARELSRLRKLKGDSLREVAQETGISNAYISQLERGEAQGPSPHKLYKLASYYDTSYEALMKAAGYLPDRGESGEEKPGPFEARLMSMDLTDEEKDMIVDFIDRFIRKGGETEST